MSHVIFAAVKDSKVAVAGGFGNYRNLVIFADAMSVIIALVFILFYAKVI